MRLEIDGVKLRIRRKWILNGIDLAVVPGVTCLLGPNGAGKTSLLRILATVHAPNSGEVRICRAGQRLEISRDRLGYVPQLFAYYSGFTTRQFLEYVASLKLVARDRLDEAVETVLVATDLTDHADQRMGTLSGGTLQRAAIAQAIVNDPELLILDEPTAGLDPSQRRAFMRLIGEIADDRIVVLSTHLVEDVTAAAKRVLVLDRGEICFDGTPHQLAGQEICGDLSTDRLADGYERVLAEVGADGA